MIQPLISCIVLSYRNFENILSTIQSVLDQDYPQIELGIFDDGSADFPKTEIEQYIEEHKKGNIHKTIVWTNPQNQGTVKNFNNAIHKTEGKYIIVISADDMLYDSASAAKIVNFFEEQKAEIVTSYRVVTDSEGNHLMVTPSERTADRIKTASPESQYKMIAMGLPIAGAGTYYSRDLLRRFGGFDEAYVLQEDGPFFLKSTREGVKIHFLPEITFRYRLGKGVSSGEKNNPLLVEDVRKLYQKEIMPYIKRFSFLEKRRILYGMERIGLDKKLSRGAKIRMVLKYPDVVIYRLIYSH